MTDSRKDWDTQAQTEVMETVGAEQATKKMERVDGSSATRAALTVGDDAFAAKSSAQPQKRSFAIPLLVIIISLLLVGLGIFGLTGGFNNSQSPQTVASGSVSDGEAAAATSGSSADGQSSTDGQSSADGQDTSSKSTAASGTTGSSAQTESTNDSGSSAQEGSSSQGDAAEDSDSQQAASTVTVTVSVSSDAVGGGVSASATPTFNQGATAYDALCACGLSVNASQTQFGIYVSAIGGLAEKEHGSMSGWVYSVNGSEPMTSCGNYILSDGDVVNWYYVTGD